MASQPQSWIKTSLSCPSLCGQWLFLAWPLHVVQPLSFLLFPLACTTSSSPKTWSNQVKFSLDFLLFQSGTSDSSHAVPFKHLACSHFGTLFLSRPGGTVRKSWNGESESCYLCKEHHLRAQKSRREKQMEKGSGGEVWCGVVWYGLGCLAGCPSGPEDFSVPRWSLAQRSGHIQQLNHICLRPKLHSHHWSAFTRSLLGRNSALIWAY